MTTQPPIKPLEQMTKEERALLFPIVLSEYNPEWLNWFAQEKARLKQLINIENTTIRITHTGSTAVPNLTAKPTVDILLEINENLDTEKLIASLPSPEYICLRQPTTPNSAPPHLMFLKGYTPTGFADRIFHIHIRYLGDHDELYFRDYLIKHPDTATKYATLKQELKTQYEYDRDGYTNAKSEFIREVVARAREEAMEFKGIVNEKNVVSLRMFRN